jgi:hypothetical protein
MPESALAHHHVGLWGCGTHHGNIFRTNGIVPDVALVVTSRTIRESLIDDIPRVAAITKVLNKLRHMVFQDFGESFISPRSAGTGDPVRQLRLPDEVVAADCLATLFRDVDEVVASGEVEDVLLWLGEFEL